MKLVTFRTDAHDRAGVLEGTDVIDLTHAFAWHEHKAGRPSDDGSVARRFGQGVLGFIEHEAAARPAADVIVDAFRAKRLPAQFDGRVLWHPLADVTLRAPIPRPPSLRDGYAFRAHVEAARRLRGLPMIPEFDQFPVFYFGNPTCVVGPGDVVVRPRHLERLDYELEAAVVVGKGGADLDVRAADAAIFGLTIMNDWSARALQSEEMKLNLGPAKGKDFATSLGPWLVTVDELAPCATKTDRGTIFDLEMTASVGGEVLSRGNMKDMSWTFAQMLSRASYGVELMPGDIVGSGTCGTGCLLEINLSKAPQEERWIAVGDVVVLEIAGLGRLESRVVLHGDGR
jgi:fumarylacetoacetate (FAA) hydrolase